MRMADQIAVMDGGRVIQVGTPARVYDQPQTIAVAKSIGTPTMNWLQAELVDGVIQPGEQSDVIAGDDLRVDAAAGPILVGLRPNAFRECRGLDADTRGQG